MRTTARLLERLVERQGEANPEDNLDLGIAYAAVREYDRGVAAMEAAIDQHKKHDYPEAHYHLGRVLYESGGDLDQAAIERRRATQKQGSDFAYSDEIVHAFRSCRPPVNAMRR